MSVKVAVRVRPFNNREKDLNSKLCVEMNGSTTTLLGFEDEKPRDFAFDYSFWSHDGYREDENGYYHPADERYADQQKVFDMVGKEVLDNAWEGYHCCLFAYGQTGSGKSYSMVGYGANKGIVPISMQEIFKRIGENDNPDLSFQVSFSMLEIYNEKIQDLLVPVKDRPSEGLKVREHQKFGVYVEGQSKHPVDSYTAIEAKVEEGSKNRTIGATLMNASSSRAHTIMTIEFKRIEIIEKKKTERFSIINLVDLAGSEKIAKTGATGDRLKEGCAINKSLSMLGLVISRLADKSMGKKNIIVPYRDSALTRILQNALGGNSKTLMICAISPATDNYDETLSTLRYADQAKKIKNHATINESQQDKMIRELREENDKLKALLKDFKLSENREKFNMIDDETLRKYLEMEEQLKANLLLMAANEKTFEEKLAEAKALQLARAKIQQEEKQFDKTKPYLMNLNEDPLLSGKVLHSLDRDLIRIGKKNGNPVPEVILGGISIKPNHAQITNKDGKITIAPCDAECGEQLFVNGQKVQQETELFHNDRIIIGTNTIFLLKYHAKEDISPNTQKVKDQELDWEFAQAELIDTIDSEKKSKLDQLESLRKKEVEQKIQSIEDKFQKEKRINEETIKKQKEEYERKLKELEENMKRETEQQKLEAEKREAEKEWKEQFAKYEADRLLRDRERERMQREVQEEAVRKRFKEQEKVRLEQKLAKHLSQITEVNLIAKELHRAITFSVKLVYNYISGAELQLYSQDKNVKTKILILVNNREQTTQYFWSLSKFTNRFFMIKDLLDLHYEGGKLPKENTTDDPFWDPPEPRLIGQGYLCLESLGYLLDNPTTLTLVGDNGPIGKLKVNVVPVNEHGEEFNENADLVDDPNELLSKRLDFTVEIEHAELPANFCQDTFCRYYLLNDQNEPQTFNTSIVQGVTQNPEFNYIGRHTYETVDDKILNYILNHNLKIQLYGFDIPEEKGRGSQARMDGSAKLAKSNNRVIQTEPSADISQDNSASLLPTDAFNQDPENKYRKTIFAPGAAVNTKHQVSTPQNFARNPKMDFPTLDPQRVTKKKSDQGKDKKEKTKGKKEDCNIF